MGSTPSRGSSSLVNDDPSSSPEANTARPAIPTTRDTERLGREPPPERPGAERQRAPHSHHDEPRGEKRSEHEAPTLSLVPYPSRGRSRRGESFPLATHSVRLLRLAVRPTPDPRLARIDPDCALLEELGERRSREIQAKCLQIGTIGAVSSVGRAPARQAGGHWFEPSTAHLKKPAGNGGFFLLEVWTACGRGDPKGRSW